MFDGQKHPAGNQCLNTRPAGRGCLTRRPPSSPPPPGAPAKCLLSETESAPLLFSFSAGIQRVEKSLSPKSFTVSRKRAEKKRKKDLDSDNNWRGTFTRIQGRTMRLCVRNPGPDSSGGFPLEAPVSRPTMQGELPCGAWPKIGSIVPHKAVLISLERRKAADCVDADSWFIWEDPNLPRGNWCVEDFLNCDRAGWIYFTLLFFFVTARRRLNLWKKKK